MSVSSELASLQRSWLDTSQLQDAKREVIIEPLIIALDALKCEQGEYVRESLCGKLLKLWERYDPSVACQQDQVAERIERYVDRLLRLFHEEWHGSRATLTHKRKWIEDAVWYLLKHESKVGRPPELEGSYRTVTVAIREDLLKRIDSSDLSRRAYLERLLEAEQPQ